MPLNARLIESVRMNVPVTSETPSTIASAVRTVRSFRPSIPRSATLTITASVLAACLLAAAGCGGGAAGPPGTSTYTLHSRLLGRDLRQTIVRSGDHRPLLVLLHGHGGNGGAGYSFFGSELDAELKRLGPREPDPLLPSGCDHSYWHDRGDGPWGRYVIQEAIPEA